MSYTADNWTWWQSLAWSLRMAHGMDPWSPMEFTRLGDGWMVAWDGVWTGQRQAGVAFWPGFGRQKRRLKSQDVPEDVILRELRKNSGKWHTHWPTPEGQQGIMLSLGDVPELKRFPVKVLVTKLNSMARRKLIWGGGYYDMRGDWHVDQERP